MAKKDIKSIIDLIEGIEEKHKVYTYLWFNKYMEEFNNYSINDIQDFMFDMYNVIEIIKSRISKEYSNYCPKCGAKLREEDPEL